MSDDKFRMAPPGGINWSPDYKSDKPLTFRNVTLTFGEVHPKGTVAKLQDELRLARAEILRLRDVILDAYSADRYRKTDAILGEEISSWPDRENTR